MRGYSGWSEEKGERIVELREVGTKYITICRTLRAEDLTVYPCDITHWRQNTGFALWGTEFGIIIKEVESCLCDMYNDDMVELTERSIKDPTMDPRDVANWLKAMVHRMGWARGGGTVKLFDVPPGGVVKTLVYGTPWSEAMGDTVEE